MLKDFFLRLENRELTGHAAISEAQKYINLYGSAVYTILSRKLNCGASAKLINSVWPGAVPVFEVQLAKTVPVEKIQFPCYAQLKYDGVRVLAFVRGTAVSFYTRNGKRVSFPHLAAEMRGFTDGVYDGELILAEGKSDARTQVSGITNSVMHGGANDTRLSLVIFDYLTHEEWLTQSCKRPYNERLEWLRLQKPETISTWLAETQLVSSPETANKLFEGVLAQGFEGLILKQINHRYSYKRSADWAKLKAVLDVDLLCIDVEEGTGKYEGQIGALVCAGQIDDKLVEVKVGSGLTDIDRAKPVEAFIGKTIEVQYNTLIQSKDSLLWSLFLPRFVKVRYDK